MNSVFQQLGSPPQYQGQISSITNSLANASHWYSTFGMCATAFNIGIQADTLVTQMLTDAGQNPVVGPTCGDVAPISVGSILGSNVLTGIGIGGLLVGGVVLYFFMKK